jgi:hypothetical protein
MEDKGTLRTLGIVALIRPAHPIKRAVITRNF